MPEQHSLAFVDSITANPTIRLSLQNGTQGPWNLRDGSRFDPPPLRRSIPQSLLADGGTPAAAAYDNRVVVLVLQPMAGGAFMAADTAASAMQSLMRELDRPLNILRYQPGTSAPVFFRTYRSGPDAVTFGPVGREITVTLLAEPFAYGLEETLPSVTVYNDPAEGTTLNSNPFFETNAANWTPTGGTFARSTAQFHEGAASGLLTPDGVTANVFAEHEDVPVTSGQSLRGSAWLRCAVGRSVDLRINFYDSGHTYNSTLTLSSQTATANAWQYYNGTVTVPVTGFARMHPFMGTTPAASNLLFTDEARLRIPGSNGAMYFDLASPKGDVETPLYLQFLSDMSGSASGNAVGLQTGLAVRRRGTPSSMPLVLQAESMSMSSVDVTVQANSPVTSGPGSNYVRDTFATSAAMLNMVQTTFPATASIDARGTYRVFARVKQTVTTAVMAMRLLWGSPTVQVTNSTATLAQDTGLGAPTWKYVDLGLVQIPAGLDPVYDGVSGVELPAAGISLFFQAQRVSGTGSLDLDCFLFVPADDRMELIQWPAVQNSASDTFVAAGGPSPSVYCLNNSGQVVSTPAAQISGTGLMVTPGRTNRVVLVRDVGLNWLNGAGDSVTATTIVQASYFPRYLFPLRPVSS